jgi:hypothetical protein
MTACRCDVVRSAGRGLTLLTHRPLPPSPPPPRQLFNVSFGVRGTRNAASWIVAGGLAYYLMWVPERQRREEIEVRWASSADLSRGLRHTHAAASAALGKARGRAPPNTYTTTPITYPQRERFLAKERAVAKGLQELDRARPIPDPQDRGLIKGAAAGGGGGGGTAGS